MTGFIQMYQDTSEFRKETHSKLVANLSLCLMKLQNYKKAKELIEILIKEGDQRLKFYLRLSNCYENLGDIEKAIYVLEKRAKVAYEKESQKELKNKFNLMLKNLKKKQKEEKNKQDDLFKKCFTLKNKEDIKNPNPKHSNILCTNNTNSSLLKRTLLNLINIIPSCLISIIFGFGIKSICPNADWKFISMSNFGIVTLIREYYNKQEREQMVMNILIMFTFNVYWIKKFWPKSHSWKLLED